MTRPQPQSDWPAEVPRPPSGDELPYDDGEPMETQRHKLQGDILLDALDHHWADRDDYFACGNMFLYFSATQARSNDFRGPDFFLVIGTERRERKSWVVWEEDGRVPDLVIEVTSPSTEEEDRGRKMRVYAGLGVREYYLYEPMEARLEGWRLGADHVWAPMVPDEAGRLHSVVAGLLLGVRNGRYRGVDAPWLRWQGMDGQLLPTGAEIGAAARAKATAAQEQATAAQEQATAAQEKAAAAQEQATAAERKASDLQARLDAYQRRFGTLPDDSSG